MYSTSLCLALLFTVLNSHLQYVLHDISLKDSQYLPFLPGGPGNPREPGGPKTPGSPFSPGAPANPGAP